MPSQEITDSQRPSARRLPEVQLADYEDYNDHCCYLRGPPERQARSTFPACAGCRGQHQRSRCPFKDAFCYRCEKRGHIAAACRAALPDDNSSPQGNFARTNRNQEPVDWDLPGGNSHSSAASALPSPGHGSNASAGREEPSSLVDTQVMSDPRRSDRTSRRPPHLEDFVTYLTE
ncbi:uncharacterized protein [Erythrolamprus reginae]|uniref:uncharacterized protein isoform X2 n=1 Tax=Erythrolamprus reginae TaxID=121349 RepID=UPI00396CC29B